MCQELYLGRELTQSDSLLTHTYSTGPGSLVSASGPVGRRFAPRSHYTKGVENGTSSSLADACIKRVYSARKINDR